MKQPFQLIVSPIVNSSGHHKQVLDRNTFQRRPASDVKKATAISEAPRAVSFGDVERNRLSGAKSLIAGMAMATVKILGKRERRGDVIDREPLDVESIVVEDWFGHWCPVSSRSTSTGLRPEYKYDLINAKTVAFTRPPREILHFKNDDSACIRLLPAVLPVCWRTPAR